jgi:hypothetical protein
MNKKSFLLGFTIAVLLVCAVAASLSDAPEIGRYQINGIGEDLFIVDTTTGVVKWVFTRKDNVTPGAKKLGVPFDEMGQHPWDKK